MNRFSKSLLFRLTLLVVVLHAAILFVVIPKVSSHLDRFYNANQYADGYDEIAANLVSGHGYRFRPEGATTLMREPGYPLLLAGIFVLFGQSFAAVKSANVLLALGTACLIALIARSLSSRWLLILGSPVVFLFHPATLVAESRGGVEILFTFFLTLFILTVCRALRSGRARDYLVCGAVLGLTVLTRSTPILFPLFLLAYLLVFERRANPPLVVFRNIAIMGVAMTIVLSPWIIRNYALTGKFVPTASVLGVAAQTGYYLSTHHPIGNLYIDRAAARERNELAAGQGYHFQAGYFQYFYNSADEVSFSQFLVRRIMGEYLRSPLLFLKVVGYNLFNFWCGGRTWKTAVMDAFVQFPLLALALLGFVISVRNGESKNIAPLPLIVIYIVGISVPILALARYSVPVIPFVSILACVSLVAAQSRVRGEDKEKGRNFQLGLAG